MLASAFEANCTSHQSHFLNKLIQFCVLLPMENHIVFIEQLRYAFKQPLPGREAQIKMAHLLRLQELERYQVAENHLLAGVVLLIFSQNDTLKIALIARSVNPRDVHSGQISFPGGRIEADDPSIEAGALRELYEEVGVAPHEVEVLGALTKVYIPVSNFMVHPFVVYAPKPIQFTAQESEVISILTPDLGHFLDEANVRIKDMELPTGHQLSNVPYFEVEGRTLWGATAMILGEFRALVERSEVV
jgi:8-oxo-dGTP pyrophosphatase MutT (NUDIX family)